MPTEFDVEKEATRIVDEIQRACGVALVRSDIQVSEVAAALTRALEVERERWNTLAMSMLRGEPKRYNWAKQNYNAGWDQALQTIRRRASGESDA